MSLFTRKDRIAIAFLVLLITVGWAFRTFHNKKPEPEPIKVFQEAVPVPEILDQVTISDTLSDKPGLIMVNINEARAEDLEKLPMIGAVKAAAIVKYRQTNGPFKKTSDIKKVKGIGKSTYEKIKDYLTVQ